MSGQSEKKVLVQFFSEFDETAQNTENKKGKKLYKFFV